MNKVLEDAKLTKNIKNKDMEIQENENLIYWLNKKRKISIIKRFEWNQ